ncbi:restriction endonuclease subunit S [Microbacterium testaceum]|uniref:restriction endonuclease subunit S n=1 Tax=Microbacterium testaceum TaxID=2033 RepID=UPI0012ACE368|nr:restriction endonuclease subunit S [Microbacterium testaceum]
MSRIDELLEELAPQGVPLRLLGEVGTFVRGNGLQKSDLAEEGVPAIHYGQIHTHYGVWAKKTKSFTSPALAAKLRHARPGDLIIATTSEDDAAVAKATAWLGDEDAAVSGDAYIYRHSLNPKFVSYFFASERFQEQKTRSVTGTKVRRISSEALSKIRIPVPPSEVQAEIVRILDQFTQLKAELEAELEARRAQLAYYRGALARARNEVPLVPLGEIAEFKYGFTDKAEATGTHRFLRITDITGQGKLSPLDAKYVSPANAGAEYVVSPGDLLMARTGATFGKTMLVDSTDPAVYASFLIRIRFAEGKLLPAYYWHFAQSVAYWDQANSLVSTGGQPQFNANVLKLVKVPVPPVEEQLGIVEVLDMFDALVNDLSIGLPAELTARRQQYEYYRDKLMTFEEASA